MFGGRPVQGTPVVLELGGKAANLVFPDAAWQPTELSLEFVRGFDRGSASYIA